MNTRKIIEKLVDEVKTEVAKDVFDAIRCHNDKCRTYIGKGNWGIEVTMFSDGKVSVLLDKEHYCQRIEEYIENSLKGFWDEVLSDSEDSLTDDEYRSMGIKPFLSCHYCGERF